MMTIIFAIDIEVPVFPRREIGPGCIAALAAEVDVILGMRGQSLHLL